MILREGISGRDKAEALKKELTRLENERREYEGDWVMAQNLVSSFIFSFEADEDESGKHYEIPKRITGAPSNFMETLVSGICGYSINPNILWLKLGLQDRKLENRYGVKDWEEESEYALYREYNRGNLYAQIPQFIEHAATYGTGVMLIDEDIVDGKIRCSTMNPKEIYYDTNEYDEIDTVFRKYFMTVENAVSYFGFDAMSGEVKSRWADETSRNKPLSLLHAVYKNKNGRGENILKDFKYASVFIDLKNDHVIRESGYDDFPYAIFTWKKISGKKYGIGPALMAVNDIKLLHLSEETRAEIAQMSAYPPMNVPKTLKGGEELLPNGRNYYANHGEIISPIQTGANYPITIDVNREFIERVKKWFNVDFFIMLQQQTRQMTATEVVELQGEKAAVLSVMVNNLNYALRKIVQRSVDILFRQGKMPPLPAALEEKRTSMKVDFMGVLAQAQRKAHQTSGIMQGIQIMQALAQIAPAVPSIAGAFDYVDGSVLLKKGFEAAGVSQLVIREDEDVEKERRARAEAEAALARQREAMAEKQLLTQNYNKLNEPINPQSAIGQLDRALEGEGA
jgi:hypothetical protein